MVLEIDWMRPIGARLGEQALRIVDRMHAYNSMGARPSLPNQHNPTCQRR